MSLQVKRSRALIDPEKFRFKVLIYGLAGSGKTEWLSSANEVGNGLGVAACETGLGKGLLTVAQKDLEYVEPANLAELEAFANGAVFREKKTIALDSLSYMNKSFIKDAALAIPRRTGDTQKRSQGVPELDDYQVMSEIARRLLAKLLDRDQHLIVTALEKDIKNEATGETLYVPDLPGALALTCTAMFDFVLRLRTRQAFKDRKDPSTRYVERYFITAHDGQGTVAKCRSNEHGQPLLDREEVFDLATGAGSFPALLKKILDGYRKETK